VKREIILTDDGSHTISVPEMKVTYHSIHGAIQESMHVFIQAGLKCVRPPGVSAGCAHLEWPDPLNQAARRILEIGFGTGLNALLTLIEADKHKNRIYYTAIELYPLNETEISQLNYCEQLNQPQYQPLFEKMHQCEWDEMFDITDNFRLTKTKCDLLDFSAENLFYLIYFDAFDPAAQPGLWTKEVFEKLYGMLNEGGIVVTYCSKGDVRRTMEAAGFSIEKLAGPPGKREMIRAKKEG
jgi:tRNA U34 5-methylaminomethyl-2-thiouridine-forming methyltransferase MnmC